MYPIYVTNGIYKFYYLTLEELINYGDLLKDIHSRKIDGAIIKNVVSEEEVNKIISAIPSLPETLVSSHKSGLVFPYPFASLSSGERVELYAIGAKYFKEDFGKTSGVDIIQRIQEILGYAAAGRIVKAPRMKANNNESALATLRMFNPGKGAVRVHCGNFFQAEFTGFYEHIKDNVNLLNQMSYFLTIQQPESGGELTLFDFEWKDVKKKKHVEDEFEVYTNDWQMIDIRSRKQEKYNPKSGEMLMFAGGEIWHQVENPIGGRDRITIGGFMAFDQDDKSLYVWA